MKTKSLRFVFVLFLIIISLLIGIFIGKIRFSQTVIQINPDREVVKKALQYHGINRAYVNSDGVYYFVRGDNWCALFNRKFRKYLAQNIKEEK